jgi:hypothetical protein
VAVDVENGRAVFFGVNNVLVKNFVVKGASHANSLCAAFDFMRERLCRFTEMK